MQKKKVNVYFAVNKHKYWIVDELSKYDSEIKLIKYDFYNEKYISSSRIGRIIRLHSIYLKIAYAAMNSTNKNDILFFELDLIGLYSFVLSKILLKRRIIVAINIMFNEGNDVFSKIKKYIYLKFINDKKVFITVNGVGLVHYYTNMFRIVSTKKIFLLRDCSGGCKINAKISENLHKTPYVFCGGINGRDWSAIKEIATLLPDIRFIIVGPNISAIGGNVPQNIDYYYNIPIEMFREYIYNCSLLALPIKTEGPAGLLVLFSAALSLKTVVTTDNITMREYIDDDINGYLVKRGANHDFADKIKGLINDETKRINFGISLKEKIDSLCSTENYIQEIIGIARIIKKNK